MFDPEAFSRVAFLDDSGSGGSVGGERDLNVLGPAAGPYTEVHSEVSAIGQGNEAHGGVKESDIVGASRDLSSVILETRDHTILPEDAKQDAGSQALYEYSGGTSTLVSVDPEGSPFRCGAALGQGFQYLHGTMHNAVSADGSKVFFTAPDPYAATIDGGLGGAGCWNGTTSDAPQLYMRSGGETLELSAPETGVSDPSCAHPEEACHPALYVGASESGSRVFFITEGELTSEAVTLGLRDPELYEYDAQAPEGDRLTRISAGEEGSAVREPGSTGAHVWNVPAVSEDGSAVYFTAFGALAPGAAALPVVQEGSAPVNLYRFDTQTGAIMFVTTVDTLDYPNDTVGTWENRNIGVSPGGAALIAAANWYTTPDGRYLLFAATSEPTGYSTVPAGNCPTENIQGAATGRCSEVFRYDADAAEKGERAIVCVSCDRSGAPPISDAFFATAAAEDRPGAPVRAISNNGAYVFFDSGDPLVPAAENKTQDVFEWEAKGTGGCEQLEGCVHLIGSGNDNSPSFFLG